jgi:hypothetical protein
MLTGHRRSWEGRRSVSRARGDFVVPSAELPLLSDAAVWQVAEGVLFSVVSSLVLWSIILASLYRALT